METRVISVMGRTFPFTILQESTDTNHCQYLENGFCHECTCTLCEHGQIKDIDKNGILRYRTCSCRTKAYNRKKLRDLGLEHQSERYSFDTYKTSKEWQYAVKGKAEQYCDEITAAKGIKHTKVSFFIAGQSGSGKSHLCVAILNRIIEAGAKAEFFRWVDDSRKLKSLANDPNQYDSLIKKYKQTDFLYIDDFFKVGTNSADLKLAFEIINARYGDGLPVIISSERTLDDIRSALDSDGEALAGKINLIRDARKLCLIAPFIAPFGKVKIFPLKYS